MKIYTLEAVIVVIAIILGIFSVKGEASTNKKGFRLLTFGLSAVVFIMIARMVSLNGKDPVLTISCWIYSKTDACIDVVNELPALKESRKQKIIEYLEGEKYNGVFIESTKSPYTIFFEYGSAEVTPEAQEILKSAARNMCGIFRTNKIHIEGHLDASELVDEKVSKAIDVQRAYNAHLAMSNVDQLCYDYPLLQPMKFSRPRVRTADGIREAQNRRVEIYSFECPNC